MCLNCFTGSILFDFQILTGLERGGEGCVEVEYKGWYHLYTPGEDWVRIIIFKTLEPNVSEMFYSHGDVISLLGLREIPLEDKILVLCIMSDMNWS